MARAFTGRAWIHEFDYELMNVEARAIDDVVFGWGMIAKLHKGIDGALLPSAHRRRLAAGRVALRRYGEAPAGPRVVFDFARDYYDYRPFEASGATGAARLGAVSRSTSK